MLLTVWLLCCLAAFSSANMCDESSCYPATGDLLIGRQQNLKSASTCGLLGPERYCIVSHLEEEKKCFVCDSRQPFRKGFNEMSHRIENVVSSFGRDRKDTWWQAENGVEYASIQFDLEAEFHFTHLIMVFRTFRPAAMLIEKSSDFGKTWKVYRYFAYDCDESFPGIPRAAERGTIGEVYCESKYSQVAPSSEGEVIFRVLSPSLDIENPYSDQVQDLLKMTNLRINFTKLHTLGDDLLDTRDEITEKYYYALYEMVVRGSCSCYGHASHCDPLAGVVHQPGMVHGMCRCTHHTKGLNCELCDDFYNDLPWHPARGRETNACKRCECSGHASRCHFDWAVYAATGNSSGGVCDECQHNTMGRQCELCQPFFYRLHGRPHHDPYTCQPCGCAPGGSENGGECTQYSEAEKGLQAGTCICKRHVAGDKCDTCKDGFWDMQESNADGCQACSCHTLGTLGNHGCDKTTGDCRCKRFVTGQNCDHCQAEFYGLSEMAEGCRPCECDPVGSYDAVCEPDSGQCRCKPNRVGRKCDAPDPKHFCPNITHHLYEAELATVMESGKVELHEPPRDRPQWWTGPGYVSVGEGAAIEFVVDNLLHDIDYELVLRYQPRFPNRWDDVRVTVVRPRRPSGTGACSNSIPQDDLKAVALPSDAYFYVLSPPSCLEANTRYTVRVEFVRAGSAGSLVNVDALLVVPTMAALFSPSRLNVPAERARQMEQEWRHYRCREDQLNPLSSRSHQRCLACPMTLIVVPCHCDSTGSHSSECNPSGGQCSCKENVVERTCDKCRPGTYGFGPSGCTPCECSPDGAQDNLCDVVTGQCSCIPNAFGRQCDECQRGFWDFPHCEPCQCNGHADTCESKTGKCLECRDDTTGPHCEQCMLQFYGEPRNGGHCRPCMCPGGPNKANQFARSCSVDRVGSVTCQCFPGYAGVRCDRCANGYFGNPLEANGSCSACDCNDNIDPSQPGACEARSGRPCNCMFNTAGEACDVCKDGYYGDALAHNCQPCDGSLLGTVPRTLCDRQTGQSVCLPNVIGRQCDQCAPGHWKIASGEGCVPCDCDSSGSTASDCNEFDGQCACVSERGGRTCADCRDLYWGDPQHGSCKLCACDPQGSRSQQCDRRTGQCVCEKGVTGMQCDRCDRGTTGELPYCEPCGECFDQWNNAINGLRNRSAALLEDARSGKVDGPTGVFAGEFERLDKALADVRAMLARANVTSEDLDALYKAIEQLDRKLASSGDQVDAADKAVSALDTRSGQAQRRLQALRDAVAELDRVSAQLRLNATHIREADVEGAFNSTKESADRSRKAEQRAQATAASVDQSQKTRQEAEKHMADSHDLFQQRHEQARDGRQTAGAELTALHARIQHMNHLVCDGHEFPCDKECGGAGCGVCGGLGCDEGARTRAENALNLARDADKLLRERASEAHRSMQLMDESKPAVHKAVDAAQMAHDDALQLLLRSNDTRTAVHSLLEQMRGFLDMERAKPEQIRQLAQQVLAMQIALTPHQIEQLSAEIEALLANLTDIDSILEESDDDVTQAEQLKRRALAARKEAEGVLTTANTVVDALNRSLESQAHAEAAIQAASQDTERADQDLRLVQDTTRDAAVTSNRSLDTLKALAARADAARIKFTANELKVQQAADAVRDAEVEASKASKDAEQLRQRHGQAESELASKANANEQGRLRAEGLKGRATAVLERTRGRLQVLEKLRIDLESQFVQLEDHSRLVESLIQKTNQHVEGIKELSSHHSTCSNSQNQR